MNSLIFPILLQIVGVLVIIAEIFIPSSGLLAIMAIAILAYSLFIVFSISVSAGMFMVVADIIILPFLIIFGLKMLSKSPATLREELSSEDGVTSQSPELEKYLGKNGVTTSDLRPSGTALIDGKRMDVVSRGNYIDKDTKIVVCSVTGNQLVVKKTTD